MPPVSHAEHGAALAAHGDPWSAAQEFRSLLDRDPSDAAAHKNLAAVLMEQGPQHAPEARVHLEEAITLAPRWADAHFSLGLVLQGQGDHVSAMSAYQQTLALDPEHAAAHVSYLTLTQAICDWTHLEALWARSRHWLQGADREAPYALTPLSVVAMPSSAAEQHEAARRWVTACGFGVRRAACGVRVSRPGDSSRLHQRAKRQTPNAQRLRVGYLSADFREHPVARQIAGVLEQHDRQRVHTTGYSLGPDDDSALRARCNEATDQWIDLAQLPAHEAARRIADDGTDVLIDLGGWTQGCRPEILALRPAPCQVSFLGYPATTAAPWLDYVLTDRSLTPPAQQHHWSERFTYLPDCYMPPTAAPGVRRAACGHQGDGPTRTDVGLPERHTPHVERPVVFCCFNHTAKITPACFDVWCRLLHKAPGSTLWLFAAHPCAPTQLRQEAEARGVEATRLVFLEHRAHEEYVALYRLADLFLDTWPYNAGATCADALAAGLPVLTLAGETYVSRMAASQLRAAGLPDMVATSVQEYERKALWLARRPSWLAMVRERLALARQSKPLFDLQRYTRHLEDAYEHMHDDLATCANS